MPKATPVDPDLVESLFHQDITWKAAASQLGISPYRLKRLWVQKYGEQAVQARASKYQKGAPAEALAEALAAFHSDEPFKAVARRLGVSPNTLRSMWVREYGTAPFKQRGRRIQSAGATAYGARTRGVAKNLEEVSHSCSRCSREVLLNRLQISRAKEILCESCRNQGKDESCPVCGLACRGQKGLASHFRHANDAEHQAYLGTKEDLKWADQVEGVDYVTCRVCGFRGKHLFNHIRIHGLTAEAYRSTYPGHSIASRCSLEAKHVSAQRDHLRSPRKGRTKPLLCSACKAPMQVAATLAPSVHSTLCETCREKEHSQSEEERWLGKKEGVDFVSCLICGHRAENLTSHITQSHPGLDYQEAFPQAPIWASKLTYGWTLDTMRQFMDSEGRVVVAAVCETYNCAPPTVVSFCRKNEIPTRNRLAWQKMVLDKAAEFLGSSYKWEWSDPRITNPDTGRPLRFDGYFPEQNFLLEAHGNQHFEPVSFYHDSLETFEARRCLDSLKAERARSLGYSLFVVRGSDPVGDPAFWSKLFKAEAPRSEADITPILESLRTSGFPGVVPRLKETRKALSFLETEDAYLDSDGVLRPYSVRGTAACASFFPNRYDARVGKNMSVREAWEDEEKLRKAILLQLDSGHPTTPERVLKALVFFCRTPSVFRPAVAKYIYQTYCPLGGTVWDPCAGYGGRLLGAVAAGVGHYIGTDVEPLTVQGNMLLAEALDASDRCIVHECRAEGFDPGEPLDLVFTSPPYYDLEVYGGASQEAYDGYRSPRGWVDQFLTPVVETALSRLKSGGVLALNLPSKPVKHWRLDLEAQKVAKQLGFREEPSIYLPVRSKQGAKQEPILIWKAP